MVMLPNKYPNQANDRDGYDCFVRKFPLEYYFHSILAITIITNWGIAQWSKKKEITFENISVLKYSKYFEILLPSLDDVTVSAKYFKYF